MGLFGGALGGVHNSTHCSLREIIELAKAARILTPLRIADSAFAFSAGSEMNLFTPEPWSLPAHAGPHGCASGFGRV